MLQFHFVTLRLVGFTLTSDGAVTATVTGGNPHVIPGKVEGKPMRNLNDPWNLICMRAGLEDVRLHDCSRFLCVEGAGARGELADDRAPA